MEEAVKRKGGDMFSKDTVGGISAEEFLGLSQRQREEVTSLMTEMQRRLLKIRLTTLESRKIQGAFRSRIMSSTGNIVDEKYVLSGGTPFEIARRIRELCCKKVAQAASRHNVDPKKELDRLSRYDRDATLVSNMKTVEEAVRYLREMGY
jgi:hypothetical protein